jgi:hypothetical protein
MSAHGSEEMNDIIGDAGCHLGPFALFGHHVEFAAQIAKAV